MSRAAAWVIAAAGLLAPAALSAQVKVDFVRTIQPIFEASCVGCHGPAKHRGDFRLDRKEEAFKGGSADADVIAGAAEKSELYRRIVLTDDDDDHMPKQGRRLSQIQTDEIRDWIDQGARWPAGLVLTAKGSYLPESPALPPAPRPSPAEIRALAALAAAQVRVAEVATNAGWREANLRPLGPRATDAAAAPLGDVASLMRLNLGGTAITDATLSRLRRLRHLTHLNLEETGVTDAGVANLRSLQSLTYLNLFGTGVTDAGLKRLRGLKNLREIYLGGTQTTPEGVKQLQAALPRLRIIGATGPEIFAGAAGPS